MCKPCGFVPSPEQLGKLEGKVRTELFYTRDQIAHRVQELAPEVEQWAREVAERTRQAPVLVCLLNGGVIFYSDLIRCLQTRFAVAMVPVSKYSRSNDAGGEVRVCGEMLPDVEDRAVLVVDDICDTGHSIEVLLGILEEMRAAEIKTVVAVYRTTAERHTPSWSLFDYGGSEWFIGYGMDRGNEGAHLPDIHRLLDVGD